MMRYGGIGRHTGLKILGEIVRVQVSLPQPKYKLVIFCRWQDSKNILHEGLRLLAQLLRCKIKLYKFYIVLIVVTKNDIKDYDNRDLFLLK